MNLVGEIIVKRREGDVGGLIDRLVALDSWMTLMAIVEETGPGSQGGGGGGGEKGVEAWSCRHCTYVNQESEICEMCGLPNE